MSYECPPYRRCGRSGLLLPAVSLGLWHDVGEGKPVDSRLTAIDQAAKEADVHA